MAKSLDLKSLSAALDESGATWEMNADNPITALTEDERRIRLGYTPPPGAPSLESASKAFLAEPPVTAMSVQAETNAGAPAKFDQRNIGGKNYTTPVKDQGGCGSCVAFGVAAVMETTFQRQTNNPTSGINLSEAHLFYCHAASEGRNCGNGWWPDKALDKATNPGVATDDMFPYTSGNQACTVNSGWQNSKATSSGKTKLSTRAAMKNWIATRGSITGCFLVYQDFFAYSSGVYRHVTGDLAGGHCIEICGYDDAIAAWICKNSWGTGWGETGYFRIGYGQCKIEEYSGPYGCNGVRLRSWQRNKRVRGLWTNDSPNNAWAYLGGVGWSRIQNNATPTQHAMLLELAGARAATRRVDALIDNNEIQELYVF